MTNKETIDRWAEQIIPAVFKAEDALLKAVPEWKERLAALNAGTSQEDSAKAAKEYCREIATIIVTQGSDYVPDGRAVPAKKWEEQTYWQVMKEIISEKEAKED